MLNRYLVFSFQPYEGSGGWEHFKRSFADLAEAKKFVEVQSGDRRNGDRNAHVVDTVVGKIVADAYSPDGKSVVWAEYNGK